MDLAEQKLTGSVKALKKARSENQQLRVQPAFAGFQIDTPLAVESTHASEPEVPQYPTTANFAHTQLPTEIARYITVPTATALPTHPQSTPPHSTRYQSVRFCYTIDSALATSMNTNSDIQDPVKFEGNSDSFDAWMAQATLKMSQTIFRDHHVALLWISSASCAMNPIASSLIAPPNRSKLCSTLSAPLTSSLTSPTSTMATLMHQSTPLVSCGHRTKSDMQGLCFLMNGSFSYLCISTCTELNTRSIPGSACVQATITSNTTRPQLCTQRCHLRPLYSASQPVEISCPRQPDHQA